MHRNCTTLTTIASLQVASVRFPFGSAKGFGELRIGRIVVSIFSIIWWWCFIGVLSVFMNRSLHEISEAAFAAQIAWKSGNRSRFELVDFFFDAVVPQELEEDAELMKRSLSRIKVLVTTLSDGGFKVLEPSSRQDLKESILKTTWVPYLTGWGLPLDDEDGMYYLDGGFSRLLHPKCQTSLHLPLIWETLVHTFSPGLTKEQVYRLWQSGYHYKHYKLPTGDQLSNSTSCRKEEEDFDLGGCKGSIEPLLRLTSSS